MAFDRGKYLYYKGLIPALIYGSLVKNGSISKGFGYLLKEILPPREKSEDFEFLKAFHDYCIEYFNKLSPSPIPEDTVITEELVEMIEKDLEESTTVI